MYRNLYGPEAQCKTEENHTMRRVVMRSPTSSCKKIRAVLRSRGTNVSVSTTSRRLSKEFDLNSRKPARKPRLMPAMKKKCLDFANRHVSWTVPKWRKVIFSYESTLQQFDWELVGYINGQKSPTNNRHQQSIFRRLLKNPGSRIWPENTARLWWPVCSDVFKL